MGPRNARRSLRSALPTWGHRFSAAAARNNTTQDSGYPVHHVISRWRTEARKVDMGERGRGGPGVSATFFYIIDVSYLDTQQQ